METWAAPVALVVTLGAGLVGVLGLPWAWRAFERWLERLERVD